MFDIFDDILEANERAIRGDPDGTRRAYTERHVSSNREKNRRLEVRFERLKLVILAIL